MKIDIEVKTKIIEKIELNGFDILNMLPRYRDDDISSIEDYTVKFVVPSGGDYSGMTLNVDDDSPVILTITSIKKEK